MITSACDKPRRQAGMATLGATVILLVLVSAIALYTSRTVLFEQRISGNDFRSRQAFEAAESGLQIALAYIGSNGGEDKDSNGVIDPVFDTNANGIGDTNTATFTDGSSVTVSVTGAFPAFNVVSVGLSNDQTASRTVRSRVSFARSGHSVATASRREPCSPHSSSNCADSTPMRSMSGLA
jgi:Tfp pilus assembly protein PilX